MLNQCMKRHEGKLPASLHAGKRQVIDPNTPKATSPQQRELVGAGATNNNNMMPFQVLSEAANQFMNRFVPGRREGAANDPMMRKVGPGFGGGRSGFIRIPRG